MPRFFKHRFLLIAAACNSPFVMAAQPWTDAPFPAESEGFYRALTSGETIIAKSWQGNLGTGSTGAMPAPLNNLTGGTRYRLAFSVPPGTSRAFVGLQYAIATAFQIGAYNTLQDTYGSTGQPDTDMTTTSAGASMRLYPIGSAFLENTQSCAQTTYFIVDGDGIPTTSLIQVDLSLQITSADKYTAWITAGKPVCGQTTLTVSPSAIATGTPASALTLSPSGFTPNTCSANPAIIGFAGATPTGTVGTVTVNTPVTITCSGTDGKTASAALTVTSGAATSFGFSITPTPVFAGQSFVVTVTGTSQLSQCKAK